MSRSPGAAPASLNGTNPSRGCKRSASRTLWLMPTSVSPDADRRGKTCMRPHRQRRHPRPPRALAVEWLNLPLRTNAGHTSPYKAGHIRRLLSGFGKRLRQLDGLLNGEHCSCLRAGVKQQLNAALSASEHKQCARPTAIGKDAPRINRVPITLLIVCHGPISPTASIP